MFSKTCFAAVACAATLLGGCTAQTVTHAASATPTSSPAAARALARTPAIACPGGTIHSAVEATNYAACEVIEGDLAIQGTSSSDLVALTNLRTVTGTLAISDNPRLQSVHGLEGLESVATLHVSNNRALDSLAALSQLTQVARVRVDHNPRLQDLSGFEQIERLDELVLHQNGVFMVDGLEGLSRVGKLEVTNNPRLISLRGLNGVAHAGSVRIEGNPRLAAQQGLLRSLATTEVPIVVKGNTGLSSTEIAALRGKGTQAPLR